MARGEGLVALLVGEGVEAEAKLYRVHVELDGELVHGRLYGKEAGDGAGAAHGRGRADVAADEAGAYAEVRGAVEEGRGFAAVLSYVVELGGVVEVVLREGQELAVGGGAEANVLLGAGAVTDVREHHLAGDDELDGAVELTCRDGAEGRVGPGKKLAAEAGADVAGDDLDIFWWKTENLGHDAVVVDDTLGALVEGDARATPDRRRSVHLHGIVGFDWGAIGVVDLDGSGGEGGIGIAAMALDVRTAGCSDGRHGVREVGAHIGFVGVVLDANGASSGIGLREGFSDHDGDVLPPIADGVVREGRATLRWRGRCRGRCDRCR